MAKRIEEQSVSLATVKPECHFVQIGREVLRTDAMPASHDTALEQREGGFNGVRCDHETVLIPDVFIGTMIHCFALRYLSLWKSRGIEHRFVSNDHVYIFADVLLHDLADCLRCAFFYVNEFQFAIAFHDANDNFLLPLTEADAFALLLSADIGFVNLDCSIQHLMDFGHGEADSMAEIPCGLVADSESALDLIRAHALLGFAEQQCSEKPLLQRQVAVV